MRFEHLPVLAYRITSGFGPRQTNIPGASTNHKGIDIVGDQRLYAVCDGKVELNYWNDVRGWTLVINIGEGYRVLYQHMREQSSVLIGSKVKAGDVIGIMGNSSKTLKIGKHLHFELHKNEVPINPEPFIKEVGEEMTEAEVKKIVTDILKGNGTEVSDWATTDMAQAIADGITDGSRPKGYATREEVAVMIERAIKREGK